MSERREVTRAEVVEQLRGLGVRAGGVLLVHTSFRAVRPVEGGPLGLIEALREALGTPPTAPRASATGPYGPPTGRRQARAPALPGIGQGEGTLVMPCWPGDDEAPFDPATMPAGADLGVVAETLRRLPGAMRSEHPFAFAAMGPEAERVVLGPLPLPPHGPESPVGRVHDLDGQVLLLGVGHDADTTVHLGEVLGGAPYRVRRHCTMLREGRAVRIEYGENDSCCERFALLDEWLGERQACGVVGHAPARLAASRDIVRVTVERVRGEPLVFLHPPSAGCAECDLARGSLGGAPP